ncbi:hypothetical protein [Nonomuraea sp. LPB2021202275-12-8]|uniref:hypothetical protein n=1 Tax=Nonomuraea sp. LPB2021202275-12-8 TaxID=3120159 RepID=UPI00300D0C0C
MKSVIKTAVAVTSFGLAAALALPVHAEVNHFGAKKAPSGEDPLGGLLGGVGGAGGVGSLLGQLTGGGLLGALGGPKAGPADPMDVENQSEPMGPANSYEDATVGSRPRPELGPRVAGLPLLSGLPLSGSPLGSLPVLGGIAPGASRMAAPGSVEEVKSFQVKAAEQETLRGSFASVADLVEGSLGGAMAKLSSTSVVPGGASSLVDTANGTARTMNGTTEGFDGLSMEGTMAALAGAAKHALPQGSNNPKLGPLVGRLVPAEAAPITQVLPGTTQLAAVDEVAPLVQDVSNLVATNGTKAAGTYTDVITSLGWSTAALTRYVSDGSPQH